jgi:hypothetical protein
MGLGPTANSPRLSQVRPLLEAGLPDGIFSNKNPNLDIFRALQWKMLVYFYRHSVHFTANWYILWTSGIVCGNSVYFSHFGMLHQKIIWQPWLAANCACSKVVLSSSK